MSNANKAYRQRNEMAIFIAKLALLNGWKAGWGTDDNDDWDDEWRTVVYIDTPEGQLCWHMDPDRQSLAKEQLPKYEGDWDECWYPTHSKRMKRLDLNE